MRSEPSMRFTDAQKKDRAETKLTLRIGALTTQAENKSYSAMINNLAELIQTANELADMEADQ